MTKTILFVDAEMSEWESRRQQFEQQLAIGTCKWLYASDGQSALQVIEANPAVQVVLTEINLPLMDGFDLLGELQEQAQNYKVIILCADRNIDLIRRAMNLGAYDFLTKPIDFDDLRATISRAYKDIEAL
ncbi:MAG: response regulator, partial [Phaeodactylibacter sp.]|nr:response regulator [Phaeodactylibacter sp.]